MSREYIDELWCPHCEEYTEQEVYDSEHERDSSHDRQLCLKCGSNYHWFHWYNPEGNKIK